MYSSPLVFSGPLAAPAEPAALLCPALADSSSLNTADPGSEVHCLWCLLGLFAVLYSLLPSLFRAWRETFSGLLFDAGAWSLLSAWADVLSAMRSM